MKTINRNKIILTIGSFCFLLAALLSVVHFVSFDYKFYDSEHSKIQIYGKSVSEHIGISDDDLKELTRFTLDYLNDADASLDKKLNIKGELREVFTDDEKLHMVDVRELNLNSLKVDYICIIIFVLILLYFLIYIKDINLLFSSYKYALIFFLIIFGFLAIWIFYDFDSFWTCFHQLFFSGNELWLLDLDTDVLIMIVPPEFFNDLVIKIVICFIISIIVPYLVLFFICRRKLND